MFQTTQRIKRPKTARATNLVSDGSSSEGKKSDHDENYVKTIDRVIREGHI